MNHESLQAMLARREELIPTEAARLQAHVAHCFECEWMTKQFAAQDSAIRAARPFDPAAGFQEQVLATVRQRYHRGPRVPVRIRFLLVVTACVVVLMGTPLRGAVAETVRHMAHDFGLMNDPLFQKTAKEMHAQGQMGYQDRLPNVQAVMRQMYGAEQHYHTFSGLFVDHEPAGATGSMRFAITGPSRIETAAYASDDGSGMPVEETLGSVDKTLIYDPAANVYTVNSHPAPRHTIPLDQIPLSVAIPYNGPTVISGFRSPVGVLANMLIHPAGVILSSFFSDKKVTIIGEPELDGRQTWELHGEQVPGVAVVPTLGNRWNMWVDKQTGVVLRLEYYDKERMTGWAATREVVVNGPGSTQGNLWSMPASARMVDLMEYTQLGRNGPQRAAGLPGLRPTGITQSEFTFIMEGESMAPTLRNGEKVRVETSAYRRHMPRRGDIILFRAVPAGQPDRYFVKRIVGLPGETVAVRDRAVFINGRRLHEPYVREPAMYSFSPRRVPRGNYFVLGDNRNNSFDSSKWSSPWLPRKDITGKVAVSK